MEKGGKMLLPNICSQVRLQIDINVYYLRSGLVFFSQKTFNPNIWKKTWSCDAIHARSTQLSRANVEIRAGACVIRTR